MGYYRRFPWETYSLSIRSDVTERGCGHSRVMLIERVYGHLLRDRSAARTEKVSYRPAKRGHLEVVA